VSDLIRISIVIAADCPEDLETVDAVLALAVPFGWEEESLPDGSVRLRVHTDNPAFCEQLLATLRAELPRAEVTRDSVPDTDWTLAWRDFFTPVPCGTHFMVIAPWMIDTVDLEGRTPIVIEPKTAFGTGHHPTTALCLGAVSELAASGRLRPGLRFLDLGTGSGILAIGCAKLGMTGVATDIDMLAVENAEENRVINAVAPAIDVRLGSTDAAQGERYDVLLANILAQPLKDLAPDILGLLAPGGCLVLSGLLAVQADGVEAAYTSLGMPPARRRVEGEWAALIWE